MNLGAAYIDILPDFSTFTRDLMAGVRENTRRAGNITVDVDADTRKFSRATDKAGKEGGKRLGAGLAAGIKFGLAGIVAGVGVAAATGLKAAIGAGSDLGETVSKSSAIWGKNAKAIDAWAKNSDKRLGISRQAALETAAQYGNMFDQIGIGGKDALKMSKGYVQLGSDLASFNNADPAAVTEALMSAQRGEYDALQKYIPTVNAAKVQAEALRQTNKKSTKDLTDAEKAQALYTIAQRDAGKAQGDFARTSGGAANQQRILAAQIENSKAKLGQSLTPAYAATLRFITGTVIPGFGKLKDTFGGVLARFTGGKGVLDTVRGLIKGISDRVLGLWSSFKANGGVDAVMAIVYTVQAGFYGLQEVFYRVQGAVIGFWQRIKPSLSAFMLFVTGTVVPLVVGALRSVGGFIIREIVPRIAGIGSAFGRLLAVVWPIVKQIVGTIVSTFRTNLPVIKGIWNNVKGIITGALDLVKAAIDRVTKIISWVWKNFGSTILATIRNAWTTVLAVIRGALGIIKNIIKLATSVLKGDWRGAWDAIKGILRSAWSIIVAVIKGAWNNVKILFGGAIRFLLGKLGDFGTYIKNGFTSAMARMKEAILKPIRDAKTKLGDMLGTGKAGIQTLFSTAVSGIGTALDKVKALAAKPINFVIGTVYNDGIRKALNLIPGVNLGEASKISNGKGGFYAKGGVLPGYTPGRDVHHFTSPTGGSLHLSGGESIMRPEFTKAIGNRGVNFLNSTARRGGAAAVARTLGNENSFARGGTVQFQGKTFTPEFASRLRRVASMVPYRISQGGFRPTTSYSGTSHRGDAVDASPVSARLVRAMRSVSIAAWDRTGMGNWAPHVHGVPLPGAGRALGSAIWQAQDYLRGGNGLGGRDNGAGSGGRNGKGILGGIAGAIVNAFKGSDTESGLSKAKKALDSLKGAASGSWGGIARTAASGAWDIAKKYAVDKMKETATEATNGFGGRALNLLTGGSNRRAGKAAMLSAGWGEDQWGPLNSLWTKESGWRTTAKNPSSGAYGIPQALPGSKMASAGKDWKYNRNTQIKWGLGYIKDRYGSPAAAWRHSQRTNWYSGGGVLPGFARGGIASRGGRAIVGENGPEEVILPRNGVVNPAVKDSRKPINITIPINLADDLRVVVQGIVDDNNEFHYTTTRMGG